MSVVSFKKNLLYNIIYQCMLLVTPLITIPYVSRVLGAEGIGTYSYTYSIVYYFMIIAMLGINNYGSRTIAKARGNKEKLSSAFWSIYAIQFIMSVAMTACYIGYILICSPEHLSVAIAQIIVLLSVFFDINWFFFGMEQFKLTVSRSIIIKIVSILMIFLFVRTSDDIVQYTIIMASSTLLSQIVLWPFLRKEILSPRKVTISAKSHIKHCLILFIPVIAVSLYKIMDKIMLGAMSGVSEVGFYEQAEKLINFPLALITALGTVILPRTSNLIANHEHKKVKELIGKSISFITFLSCPIALGLIAAADNFVPLFMGDGFAKSSILVCFLAVTVIFLSFANIIRTGFMTPKEMDKEYAILTITGGVVNLIINLILIPKLQSIGACIGTVVAEFVVMVLLIWFVRKDLPVLSYMKKPLIFLGKSIIMFCIVMLVKLFNLSDLQTVIAQTAIGVGVYAILNYNYISKNIKFRGIILKG